MEHAYPVIRATALDTTDARGLAEFYRLLFGLHYRPGDEPPAPGQPDPKAEDWLVSGARRAARRWRSRRSTSRLRPPGRTARCRSS